MAGGINDYGNLTKIKIIRSENNKKQIHKIDLTSSDILTSDFFYLRNNDLSLRDYFKKTSKQQFWQCSQIR